MRKTAKSSLSSALKYLSDPEVTLPHEALYVVDGGYLLHTVIWPKPATYQMVYDSYRSYILKHYKGATVIFDGYSQNISAKHAEQARRSKKTMSANIKVAANLPTTTSQTDFLGNKHNKS